MLARFAVLFFLIFLTARSPAQSCRSALLESQSGAHVESLYESLLSYAKTPDFLPKKAEFVNAKAQLLLELLEVRPDLAQQVGIEFFNNEMHFGSLASYTNINRQLFHAIKKAFLEQGAEHLNPRLAAQFFKSMSESANLLRSVMADDNFLYSLSLWNSRLPLTKSAKAKFQAAGLMSSYLNFLNTYQAFAGSFGGERAAPIQYAVEQLRLSLRN